MGESQDKSLNELGQALLERARSIASRCGRDGRVLGVDGMRSDLSDAGVILATIGRHAGLASTDGGSDG